MFKIQLTRDLGKSIFKPRFELKGYGGTCPEASKIGGNWP